MISDLTFWIGKKILLRGLKAQWRRERYGWGGSAWTGAMQ